MKFGLGDKSRINYILKIYQRLSIFYEKVSAPNKFSQSAFACMEKMNTVSAPSAITAKCPCMYGKNDRHAGFFWKFFLFSIFYINFIIIYWNFALKWGFFCISSLLFLKNDFTAWLFIRQIWWNAADAYFVKSDIS